jgi:RNA-splicing ligase RtcB
MADKVVVIKEKMDHSGIFDFKGFYNYAHSWFVEEGFGVVENRYSEKVSGNSRNIMVEWMASKSLSDYFKVQIKLKLEINELTDVEVEIDKERKKMNKGKIKLDATGTLVFDHENKWENSALSRFFRDVYNKYVIPGRVVDMQGLVVGSVANFKEEMKAFLELSGQR